MKKVKIALTVFSVMVLLLPVLFAITVTIANDIAAANVAKDLESIPLPEATVFIESISKAGKLIGNGNGMQYFGAMLISSGLPLEELQSYYTEYDCDVYIQETSHIDIIDHGSLSFKNSPIPESSFIVADWGGGVPEIFKDFDIRGH